MPPFEEASETPSTIPTADMSPDTSDTANAAKAENSAEWDTGRYLIGVLGLILLTVAIVCIVIYRRRQRAHDEWSRTFVGGSANDNDE
ncbi:hypothetical protein [Nonomuraea sp. PA05]|uniref:hypothetical protein n=1 Tax=Nonomuraea sp. PA05 TaxID=2604466 RepID=UPI001CA30659|nr:hypothetical protein [Nonomuraea sp. PA05]